jgi:hypothetical protein
MQIKYLDEKLAYYTQQFQGLGAKKEFKISP